ncbi:unnamed protein product [Staurois parvus]|uniref:Uncharacterized protein n=1 Tax=Staurois parvus TaxID=386267 RepID=A0ABN9F5J4_9NEOB|nr:unnamed protein product [Staurois parvus]
MSQLALANHRGKLTGETPTCCFVSPCTAERYKTACFPSKTQHTVKYTQHTVNPLITPDVNPFLSSVISTVSVLFISTDHCKVSLGMSVAVCQFPPSVRMPTAVPL